MPSNAHIKSIQPCLLFSLQTRLDLSHAHTSNATQLISSFKLLLLYAKFLQSLCKQMSIIIKEKFEECIPHLVVGIQLVPSIFVAQDDNHPRNMMLCDD